MINPDEEDIIVEITPDETDESQVASGSADTKEEKPAPDIIRQTAEEYERNLEAERAAKKEAEERALKAEREASQATHRARLSESETIDAAISIVEKDKAEAKRLLKEAMEKGDFDGVVAANEKLSEATVNITKLKEAKVAVERAPTREAPTDPVEGYISRFTPRSQAYLRQNKEYVTDPAKNKLLVSAHYAAEANGLVPDTDAYFQFLDAQLKPAPKTQETPKRMPAAPVSRGNDISSGGSGGERIVKLTPGQARAATDGTIVWNHGPNKGKPIGVKEYARRLEAMGKDYSEMEG